MNRAETFEIHVHVSFRLLPSWLTIREKRICNYMCLNSWFLFNLLVSSKVLYINTCWWTCLDYFKGWTYLKHLNQRALVVNRKKWNCRDRSLHFDNVICAFVMLWRLWFYWSLLISLIKLIQASHLNTLNVHAFKLRTTLLF